MSRLFPEEEAHSDAVRRARTVRNKAEEHFEERGLQTLFLTCGMATWTNQRGRRPRGARPFRPGASGAAGRAQDEFELAMVGELEVNPTLLQLLSRSSIAMRSGELLARPASKGAVNASMSSTTRTYGSR